MKSDTVGVFGEFENFHKMPRDCFAFAVFISCEPDSVSACSGFFEVVDNFSVIGINFISDIESIFIDFGILADVPY